uniref:Uncharacterized protein n=1 Tax=Romanomermis culicivorax TaxID=13658 RepID=A0A915IPB7_ROMCU
MWMNIKFDDVNYEWAKDPHLWRQLTRCGNELFTVHNIPNDKNTPTVATNGNEKRCRFKSATIRAAFSKAQPKISRAQQMLTISLVANSKAPMFYDLAEKRQILQ